ncbi:hypothetical protein QR680_017790 [Steinernema hermaphroditum]|uniref:Uncharacterized protein n=1 Tax=Steinernema hermaphroditum TaxID=289476 RepID=A0AA39LPA4_9BILA|nr:hypothetical protein QR680_017790 [Steinernema hermaphroditum]
MHRLYMANRSETRRSILRKAPLLSLRIANAIPALDNALEEIAFSKENNDDEKNSDFDEESDAPEPTVGSSQ